jgi:type II secretory pathway pseudopilin PulG
MRAPASKQQGFTYLGLLFAVVIMGLMLTVVARVWRTTVQREREAQLLWVGHAYRMAISSYFALGHQYPATLQDLITDERFPVPKHHLRRLYPDPLTGRADWTLVLTPSQSGIQGVASSSQNAPIKRDGFEFVDGTFKDSDCYCQWKFIYAPYRWTGWGTGAGTAPPLPGASPPGQPGWGSPSPGGPTTAPGIPLPLPSNPTPLAPTPGAGPH